MLDPKTALLGKIITELCGRLAGDETDASIWAEARQACATLGEDEEDLAIVIELEDAEELRKLVEEWSAGKRPLPAQDRAVLKRAMKAYRKRLKLLLLDEESTVGGGPMSGGRESDVVGITPPSQYPSEIWDELVRLGQLRKPAHGIYELGPGG
jgi:hypothetical protein